LIDAPKKKIKIYLAILNRGWLRREVVTKTLPAMRHMRDVELVFENPSLTWDQPIFSNRNKITRRFLTTDCDFLLMMDDDIVPMAHNPCELVFANKDIIGFPAKVRQSGRAINWVAYVETGEPENWAPIDLAQVDSSIDLLKVAIVGTGCILIARRVLEAIPAPFNVEIDERGECKMGTDFAFCNRAGKAGFEVYVTPWRWCEHFKEFGLLDITGYDSSDDRNYAPAKYRLPWGTWSIQQIDWEFIQIVVGQICPKDRPLRILEFGCGLSTLLFAERHNVIAFETDPDVKAAVETKRTECKEKFPGTMDIRLWDGFDSDDPALLARYDLVFVDGPTGEVSGGPGRKLAMEIAAMAADHVIVHDAGRDEETMWQNKYLKPHFKLIGRSGNHQIRCHYWRRKAEEE
jgi:hypothetical protein